MLETAGMIAKTRWLRFRALLALASAACIALTAHFLPAQTADGEEKDLAASFERVMKPFFARNCASCHNSNLNTAGLSVEQLDASFEDRQLRFWEGIRNRVRGGTMPPKGLPQPTPAERDEVVAWITRGLEFARLRPAPKNGVVRRLTVAQYRNTLKELLQLDDDVAAGLPPD